MEIEIFSNHMQSMYFEFLHDFPMNFFLASSLWGTFNALLFNTIAFLAIMSHVRAVFSDPGVVPLPKSKVDFSDLHAGP